MYNPKVSVILSCYNSSLYLKKSIESILSQTFNDFEFIIINDGSSDNTLQIIQSYASKDERIDGTMNEKRRRMDKINSQA